MNIYLFTAFIAVVATTRFVCVKCNTRECMAQRTFLSTLQVFFLGQICINAHSMQTRWHGHVFHGQIYKIYIINSHLLSSGSASLPLSARSCASSHCSCVRGPLRPYLPFLTAVELHIFANNLNSHYMYTLYSRNKRTQEHTHTRHLCRECVMRRAERVQGIFFSLHTTQDAPHTYGPRAASSVAAG